MVTNTFPCDSQHLEFSVDKDLAAEVIKHVTSAPKGRMRDKGLLSAKTGKIWIGNSLPIPSNYLHALGVLPKIPL